MPARFVEAGSDAAEAVCAKGSQELPAGIRVLVAHQRRKEHRHILADSAGMLVAAAVTGGQRPGPSRLPQTPPAGETGRTDNRPRLAGQGLHRHNVAEAAARAGVSLDIVSGPQTRRRVPSPTATLGRRTHQRMDQRLPATRPPLRSHPRRARGLSGPQSNRPTTAATRPQPVVRHALVTGCGSGSRRLPLARSTTRAGE